MTNNYQLNDINEFILKVEIKEKANFKNIIIKIQLNYKYL